MSAVNFNQPIKLDGVRTIGHAICRVDASDLTAEASSQVLTFNTLAVGSGDRQMPANARVMYAWVNVIKGFSGEDVTDVKIEVGDAGDDDELIGEVSVKAGAEGVKPKSGAYTLGTFEIAYAPIITVGVTGSGAEVVDVEDGVMEVFIAYEAIDDPMVTR